MLRNENNVRWALAALTLALLLAVGCGGEPAATADNSTDETAEPAPERTAEEIQADFDATMEAYNSTEDQEEKFQLWFDFLDRNPDNRYTVGTISYLARQYYGEHTSDPEGGIAFVNKHLENLTGERVEQAEGLLIGLYGQAGDVDKLREMAAEMESAGKMDYSAHMAFANAASSAQAWDLGIQHTRAAVELATPEAVRADAGDREMSEEDIANRANSRKAEALTTLGRMQLESGAVDAALQSFSDAEEFVTFNYVGVPAGNINLHWAKALIASGDYDAAMRRIAPDAIMQGHDGAMEVFKEAYEKSGGNEAGLDRAIEGMRAELAHPVQNFEAYTYDGKKIAWSELKGKVTMLAFWFPT